MINMRVLMAEEGKDAMGLFFLMIGLSECCNGLGCQRGLVIYATSSCRHATDAACRGESQISAFLLQ